MKWDKLAAILAVVMPITALAADKGGDRPSFLPLGEVAAQSSWSGFYVGAHAGYGWGDMNVDLSTSSGAVHYNDHFAKPDETLNGGDGWLGGFQIGVNKQSGNIVAGIEADVSWTDMDGEGRYTTQHPHYATWDIKSKLEMFGTMRGRLGVATGPVLVYATGGLAWGITETSQATNWFKALGAPSDDVGGRTSGRNNHIGWTAGGGIEWAIAQNLTLRGEYLYVDLGEESYALRGTTKPNGSTPYVETFGADLDFHVVRGGLNFKLN